MATYTLISDIHGNVDALRTVLEHIEAGPAFDEIVCLGDIIGYCPGVNEVIEELRSLDDRYTVRYNVGSHDAAALGDYQFVDLENDDDRAVLSEAGLETEQAVVEEYFSPERRRFVPVRPAAREAMAWTLEHLRPGALTFLQDRLVPRLELEPGVISVHGSPRDPACEYVRDAKAAQRCFESPRMDGVWLCLVGHTHLPVAWEMPEGNVAQAASRRVALLPPERHPETRLKLRRPDSTYIINVGSVGQPRDRDPRACYGRLSTDENEFEHVRIEYDIDAAAARIREAGFDERLAERLYVGE
ncbi:MAG: metallophosphoesterase family protein [bacterium]